MNCKNCGNILEEGASVCSNCGELVYPNQQNFDNTSGSEPSVENISMKEETPSKSKTKLSMILIAVGVLFIAIGALLPLFNLSGKQVVEKEVTALFHGMKQVLKEREKQTLEYDLENEAIGISGTLTASSDYKDGMVDLTQLNNYELNYQAIIDKKSNEASAKIDLSKGKNSLLLIDGYINAKDIYLSLGDAYEKIITTQVSKELKDFDLSRNDNIEDTQKLLDKTEKLIKSYIDEKDIQKTKVEKEINGKKENLTKISYKVNTYELRKHLYKGFLEDKESLQLLSKWTSMSESDLKTYLEYGVKTIEEYSEYYKDTIEINIYIKGVQSPKEIEIIDRETSLIIDKIDNIYQYHYKQNGNKIFSGEYDSKNKKLTLTNESTSLTIQQQKDIILIDIMSSTAEEKMNIHVESKNKVSKSTWENDATIDIEYGEMKLSVKNQVKLEKNQKPVKINSDNLIDIKSITAEEYAEVNTKMNSKLAAIIQDIAPVYMDYLSPTNNTTFFKKNIN